MDLFNYRLKAYPTDESFDAYFIFLAESHWEIVVTRQNCSLTELVVKGNIGMRDGEIFRTTDSVYQLSTSVLQTPDVMGSRELSL